MSLKKFKLCKPSNVAFKHLQEILPKNGYRIVVLDRLHQVLHVKKNGLFFSKFLTIKIKLVGDSFSIEFNDVECNFVGAWMYARGSARLPLQLQYNGAVE